LLQEGQQQKQQDLQPNICRIQSKLILLQENTAHNGSNKNTQKPTIIKTQHDLKTGINKTEVKIKRCDEHNITAPVDKPSNRHSSKIKKNPRILAPREKFFTADQLDKVEHHHKTRSNSETGNYTESKLIVQVDLLSEDHPS